MQPVLRENFPDAFVMPEGNGSFIAYATNDVQNVPMAVSRDLVNWTSSDRAGKKADAMPTLAPWVKPGFTWAPEVMKVGASISSITPPTTRAGQAVPRRRGQRLRAGPFVDASAEPDGLPVRPGGSIDANPFRDRDGKLYLYWKADGNRIGKRSRLWGAPLTPDG
jgi:beta-xylosidase